MRRERVIVAGLLFLFTVMCVYSMTQKSITNDELTHITSGYSYVKAFDFRMNPEHPPLIKILAGIPLLFLGPEFPTDHVSWVEGNQWVFGAQFLYFQNENTDQLIFWARLPMVLVGVLLGLYVFRFAKELYGQQAGYLALFLFTFSPNILAHARLVTTDVGLSAFAVMTVFYWWRVLENNAQRDVMLTGLSFGLAMASKFSAVYLLPILVIMGALKVWEALKNHKGHQDVFAIVNKEGHHKAFALVVLIGLAMVVLSYGVVHVGQYIQGFINVAAHSQRGHNAFLMGEFSNKGFFTYFPIAFLIKTPLAMLALILTTIIFYSKLGEGWKFALKRDLVLFVPIAVFVGSFLVNQINIGLRHILPAYPFLFIWVSQTVNLEWDKVKKGIFFAIIILAYLGASLSIAPHYLAYFNSIVGGPDKGYQYLIDSNIDWGQDLKGLGQYVKENDIKQVKMAYFGKDSRAYRGINWTELKCAPESGIIAVSVNRLVGFDPPTHECLAWLRIKEPVTTIGHSIFVYDIKEDEIRDDLVKHCDQQCRQKCEGQMQLFVESVFEEKCTCRCQEIIN